MRDVFLAVEKEVIVKLSSECVVFVLFGAFYVLNVNYPVGCTNLYLILDVIFLNKCVSGRRPRVTALQAELKL